MSWTLLCILTKAFCVVKAKNAQQNTQSACWFLFWKSSKRLGDSLRNFCRSESTIKTRSDPDPEITFVFSVKELLLSYNTYRHGGFRLSYNAHWQRLRVNTIDYQAGLLQDLTPHLLARLISGPLLFIAPGRWHCKCSGPRKTCYANTGPSLWAG